MRVTSYNIHKLTLTKTNKASYNQHDYSYHLTHREDDLHARGPLHAGAVHEQNDSWKKSQL